MPVNQSLIDLLEVARKVLKEWETFPTEGEYGTFLSEADTKKLFADMRAVGSIADYICSLTSDPFMSV